MRLAFFRSAYTPHRGWITSRGFFIATKIVALCRDSESSALLPRLLLLLEPPPKFWLPAIGAPGASRWRGRVGVNLGMRVGKRGDEGQRDGLAVDHVARLPDHHGCPNR